MLTLRADLPPPPSTPRPCGDTDWTIGHRAGRHAAPPAGC